MDGKLCPPRSAPATYHIRVAGLLDPERAAWFDGLSLTHTASNETLLSGPVRDQTALHGLLSRVRDLGLTLLAVTRDEEPIETDATTAHALDLRSGR